MTLPTLPVPATWSTGEVVLAPLLRSSVSDAVALLSGPPMFIGQQTVTGQSITSSLTPAAVTLDTELADNWGGHRINANAGSYFGMFAGWYICEAAVPMAYTGGAGELGGGVGGNSSGGSFAIYMGMTVGNNSGANTAVSASKLLQMTNVGVYASAGNDYVRCYALQTSGGTTTLSNGPNQIPTLSCTWAAANSGHAGLSTPANPAWPVPPTVLSASFMNANVRDAIRFLIYPPLMEYSYTSTGQNLASQSAVPSVGTTMNLSVATVDNYSAFNNSANVWVAPAAGLYYAYGQVAITSAATTQAAAAGLTVASANYNSGSPVTLWGGASAAVAATGGITCVIVQEHRLRLNAGDTVALAGFQRDSGSNSAPVLGTGDWQTRLITVWQAS